ncbi:tetratricopeptide repeat protein [Schaalia sp. HMT-877]|nr:tetratricopeptide repeat protein [Actinomyces sp. oral taxon 877 str. F0543]WLD80645.1 tetratricopeptide repeat protein [Schaalia sp. HMT-877]
MSAVSISRFTPSTMPEDLLARLFVVRQPVLESLMKRVGDLGATPSPHHTLLVGPRGAGKTHLISLVYHRAKNRAGTDGGKPLRIAWLPEDPWTIVSYARLLAAILERVAPDTGVKSADEAELDARLRSTSRKDGPVLVLMENVDQILDALGEVGQQKLRNLLQTESGVLIIGSTTRLDRSLSSHAAPFFGFFDTIRLEPFSPEEAREMLTALAREADNAELAERLSSSGALARIHTIAHLAGGQPRLWALLGSALTVEELRDLAALLLSRFDDLTPYYQEQLARLSPLQRLVVAELAAADRPLPVKDIAERVGSDQRSVAKAVGDLAERGWLKPVSTIFTELLDRRRTYYDLAEPLARLAFQIKESRGEPLPLVVDFLVNWFDADQLRSSDGSDYGRVALMRMEQDEVGGLARRLTSLPKSRIPSLDLLGQVEDALAAFSAGDAEPVMALRSTLRQAIELRAHDEGGIASVRLELLEDALREVGDVPRGDANSAWVVRAERLDAEAQSPQSRLMLVRWLAASWRFDEAEAALGTISSEQAALEGANDIAQAYESAGRFDEAIPLYEKALADSVRVLGDDHPDVLGARNNLAVAYRVMGRLSEAIALFEEVVADSVRVLGPDRPHTLASRGNLAVAYQEEGRLNEAIPLFEEVVADSVRVLGPDHPHTLVSRYNLAGAYREEGCLDKAIPLYEGVLADRVRILGADHPHTLVSRIDLAGAYQAAGRLGEATTLFEGVLADHARILGDDHPLTFTARNALAGTYQAAGRLSEAIPLYEGVLADRVRVLGMDHPDTLTARHNLADAHQAAGHLSEAISLFEEALAGRMRILGPIHSDTLVSRSHLAYAYLEAGRVDDATVVLDPPTDPDDVDAHRIESR